MDFFVVNGKIWQKKGQFCESLILKNGRINAAGTAEALERISGGCRLLDCGGKTVIPGLFDPYGEPPQLPQTGRTGWLEGQLAQFSRAGITSIQWPDWDGQLTRVLLPILRMREGIKPQPRLQLLTRQNRGWQAGFGGRLARTEELPYLWRQGGQILVPILHRRELEQVLRQLTLWPLPAGNPRRLTLVGADCTDSAQLQALGTLGVGLIGFPTKLEHRLQQCAGEAGGLTETCCAWRTLSRLGAKVAFGGIDRVAPFAGLKQAVCRSCVSLTGESLPSKEGVSVEEGLEAMTADAAWMDFQEDFVGRLLPGYRADLLVLSGDPFTCPTEALDRLHPVLTMAGGEILWQENNH